MEKNESVELLKQEGRAPTLSSSAQSKPRETVGRRATGLKKEESQPSRQKKVLAALFLCPRGVAGKMTTEVQRAPRNKNPAVKGQAGTDRNRRSVQGKEGRLLRYGGWKGEQG
jgi:hypothetical protein